jgi:hypothetical protein
MRCLKFATSHEEVEMKMMGYKHFISINMLTVSGKREEIHGRVK